MWNINQGSLCHLSGPLSYYMLTSSLLSPYKKSPMAIKAKASCGESSNCKLNTITNINRWFIHKCHCTIFISSDLF